MIETLRVEYPIARKAHHCNACDWLISEYPPVWRFVKFTFNEKRQIAIAKSNNWNIMKGERYELAIIKQDGFLITVRSIIEIHKICLKYKLYVE